MLTLNSASSDLLVIDFQTRLMPAIHESDAVISNAFSLIEAARHLNLPMTYTEQNPEKLGHTLTKLAPHPGEVLHKMTFDALRTPKVAGHIDGTNAIVVTGCEAHVCVLQTVLGLIDAGRQVFVVADAVGSRTQQNRQAALERMARHGAEIVTTEMVIFEWLGSAEHPSFRDILKLVK